MDEENITSFKNLKRSSFEPQCKCKYGSNSNYTRTFTPGKEIYSRHREIKSFFSPDGEMRREKNRIRIASANPFDIESPQLKNESEEITPFHKFPEVIQNMLNNNKFNSIKRIDLNSFGSQSKRISRSN